MNATIEAPVRGAHSLEPQDFCVEIRNKKYLWDGESLDEMHTRVARALANVPSETDPAQAEVRFTNALKAGFIVGGRIAAAAGRKVRTTMINCFVQPIGDAMSGVDESGCIGIFPALTQAAETMRRGGGVGYNFSSIRPAGAKVKGTLSRASGPMPYMDTFSAMCDTVESAGARRGAQMGVLDIEHPDIAAFIDAKTQPGRLERFNISVAVSDEFMAARKSGSTFELVHAAEPDPDAVPNAYRREDGKWVYQVVDAKELWDRVMGTTFDYAEPGVLYMGRVNARNPQQYTERISASNPCGEQPLPPYGCCCLGSIDLTRFVVGAFTASARFDFKAYTDLVAVAHEMLDNVLDATVWPLPEQEAEAMAKRRVGQGYLGLGSAMIMLGIRYGSDESVEFTRQVTRALRDGSLQASSDLSARKGTFPLFDAEKYLASEFAADLPPSVRKSIARQGLRNSHTTSIAPTGTISLAFADNASGGIEPAFALTYNRTVVQDDGTKTVNTVQDHAYRRYLAGGGSADALPDYMVTAQEISVEDHVRVAAAAAAYVDSAISKTVNVPNDYPFEAFCNVYTDAYEMGLKGITTYRAGAGRAAVLSVPASPAVSKPAVANNDPDRRLVIKPADGLQEWVMRWPSRPDTPDGAPSWTFAVRGPQPFAVTVAHVDNGTSHPFEVWVQGDAAPRGLAAVAKTLSFDMRTKDPQWLRRKLKLLNKSGRTTFEFNLARDAPPTRVRDAAAALAVIVEHRAEALGFFEYHKETESPMLMALASAREPKAGPDGQTGWLTDVRNDAMSDDFTLIVKEADMTDGTRFPFSVWASGDYPPEWDALFKSLSLDMRISDPRWIGAKLKQLQDWGELRGEFWAAVPGSDRQAVYPSTIAYVATLLLARYRTLGILDENAEPLHRNGLFVIEQLDAVVNEAEPVLGFRDCGVCHASRSVIKRDGCEQCGVCGDVGSCG